MPDNSVPPHVSLIPFYLMPRCWSSERVSPISLCVGPLRENAWDSRNLLSLSYNPAAFHSQKLWGLLFPALESWAGGPGVWLGPLAHGIPLPIFLRHSWVWDQTVPHLCPSYQAQCSFFFNSVVVGLPLRLISDRSECWLFCSSAIISMWLCKEASCVYLRCHPDQKTKFVEIMYFSKNCMESMDCCGQPGCFLHVKSSNTCR